MNLKNFFHKRWGKILLIWLFIIVVSSSVSIILNINSQKNLKDDKHYYPPLQEIKYNIETWKVNESDKDKKYEGFWAFFFFLETSSCLFTGDCFDQQGKKLNNSKEERMEQISLYALKREHYPKNYEIFQDLKRSSIEADHFVEVKSWNLEVYYSLFLSNFLKKSSFNVFNFNDYRKFGYKGKEWLGKGKYVYFSKPFSNVTIADLNNVEDFTEKTYLNFNKKSFLEENKYKKFLGV